MNGFLAEVVREVRADVRSPSYAGRLPPLRGGTRPSLRAAVERDRARGALVVEFKRASPGQPEPALPARSVAAFLRAVEPAEPAAFSCLATGPRFGGSPHDVADLARGTPRPVLFKDFVLGPRQIEAAERSGASAVLLIARLETEGHLEHSLAELARAAHDRGLEVLLEFHQSAELSRADGVSADVYGVNVRDLDSLALDRATAIRTLDAARAAGLAPLLGLSGVAGRADAETFWNAGTDGLLVGTAVARANDPAAFLRSLRRTTVRSEA
jgi:indole-3-glycerol phosphate synthase